MNLEYCCSTLLRRSFYASISSIKNANDSQERASVNHVLQLTEPEKIMCF